MRRIAIILVLMLIAVPAFAGLKEKRAVKDFQDKSFPKLTKEINAVAGTDIPVEVDWDSLAVDGYSDLYEEGFTKVYFTPLLDALKEICADDMGKTALKEALKKVVIKNSSNSYSPSNFSFSDGVLVIDHSPTSNLNDTKERTKKIAKLLEDAL
jgi:hypothetical protein